MLYKKKYKIVTVNKIRCFNEQYYQNYIMSAYTRQKAKTKYRYQHTFGKEWIDELPMYWTSAAGAVENMQVDNEIASTST